MYRFASRLFLRCQFASNHRGIGPMYFLQYPSGICAYRSFQNRRPIDTLFYFAGHLHTGCLSFASLIGIGRLVPGSYSLNLRQSKVSCIQQNKVFCCFSDSSVIAAFSGSIEPSETEASVAARGEQGSLSE
jgi:hypothetical protein